MDRTIPYIVKLCATTLEKNLNVWCDSCLLPTGYDCLFAVEIEGAPLEVLHLTGCSECGPHAEQTS